ncbi:hypothetical protein RRG08_019798 [Elysia crispata]|uniref:Uncharacterized protein n=1 Tax=Elysia crispata TaxID=231223 RepID=A0AAE1AW70_9GAST|nr:hypothetical protein RRG08_019798 [Elysia crispata]
MPKPLREPQKLLAIQQESQVELVKTPEWPCSRAPTLGCAARDDVFTVRTFLPIAQDFCTAPKLGMVVDMDESGVQIWQSAGVAETSVPVNPPIITCILTSQVGDIVRRLRTRRLKELGGAYTDH